jgi:hypothetical protein
MTAAPTDDGVNLIELVFMWAAPFGLEVSKGWGVMVAIY